ncbi:MAG: 3-hydroxylacyl-ACP dehydratase [Burkholderiaceae bacterium]|nr:3-hydroxylacyl-ACP dehydratase [Burkholderiaceae bacterium]
MLTLPLDAFLPHAGRMRLIDRVISYDEQKIICESDSHRVADHPLAEDGVISIVCGLEYGAQAMALHGALMAASSGGGPVRRGYLVAASNLRWSAARLDACAAPLIIEAISEFRSENQVAYRFEIRTEAVAVLTGDARVQLSVPDGSPVHETGL